MEHCNLYKYAGLNWWAIYQIALLILRHLCWASFLEYLAPFDHTTNNIYMLNWQLTISPRSTLNILKNVCLNSNRNMPVAALPVTQQMTEMSISREDKVTTPKTEVSEPGMLFIWFFISSLPMPHYLCTYKSANFYHVKAGNVKNLMNLKGRLPLHEVSNIKEVSKH